MHEEVPAAGADVLSHPIVMDHLLVRIERNGIGTKLNEQLVYHVVKRLDIVTKITGTLTYLFFYH